MPPKKKQETKTVPRIEEEKTECIDALYNPDMIQSYLDELRIQLEKRIEQLQRETTICEVSIRQLFQVEMIKLNREIRQMPLSRFKSEYGDSIDKFTNTVFKAPVGTCLKPKITRTLDIAPPQTPMGMNTGTVVRPKGNLRLNIPPSLLGSSLTLKDGSKVALENIDLEHTPLDVLEKLYEALTHFKMSMGTF